MLVKNISPASRVIPVIAPAETLPHPGRHK